jgi:hypothetical protein
VIWGGYLKCQVKRIDSHDPKKGGGRGRELMPYRDVSDRTNDEKFNVWEIRVREDGFDLYVNNRFVEDFDDITYIHDPYYGIFTSTYEYNSASFEHDFYYVIDRASAADPTTWDQPVIEIEHLAQME